METVILQGETGGHIINKYNFKVLPTQANTTEKSVTSDDEFVPASKINETKSQGEPSPVESEMEESSGDVLSKSSKDELIESLLKKTDEMSSNFIKMQMKLEAKDEEYKAALDAAKAEAFEEGKIVGTNEAQQMAQNEHAELMKQFSSSIETLDRSTKEFSNSIEGIQEELIHAALDIAKEVIIAETAERGSEIAGQLAKDLITEIKSSSAVTIKVNPNDKVAVEQSLGTLENVKIISDNAISNGGVVILSDAGNIDGDIMKRYERVKSAALDK